MIQETISRNANWNEGHEALIKKNLLIGNLQYAAEVALKCGRSTLALLIAERGDEELFQDIKKRYFETEKDPFITQVVQGISQYNLESFTDAENLRQNAAAGDKSATNWKENLAYLYNYHTGSVQQRNETIKEMGDVLVEQRDISAALVCYILSMNVKEVLEIWRKRAIHVV